MTALFWLCWIIDLLLCAVAIVGKGFANSFHAGGSVPWLAILLIGSTTGALLLHLVLKKSLWPAGLAALPLIVLFILYLVEKATGEA